MLAFSERKTSVAGADLGQGSLTDMMSIAEVFIKIAFEAAVADLTAIGCFRNRGISVVFKFVIRTNGVRNCVSFEPVLFKRERIAFCSELSELFVCIIVRRVVPRFFAAGFFVISGSA